MNRIIVLIIFIALSNLFTHAQNPATSSKDDSTLSKTALLMQKLDSTKRADSLKRIQLINEINNLKGSEANKQREILLGKLKEEEAKDSIRKAKQINELEKLKASANGYPVTPFGDTLFSVYTKVGSFSPRDRATAIENKIKKLYNDAAFKPDSLALIINETSTDIVFNDLVVMSINELEAMWFGKSPELLAKDYQSIISKAISEKRENNSIINILLRIGAIILIIAGIYFLIRIINRLFKRLNRYVITLKDTILKGIRFRGYQFLDSDRELKVALFLINIIRLFIIALTLYITLPLLFSVFPWTRGIAETLFSWVTKPIVGMVTAIVTYLPNLFTIIIIIVITHYVAKFLRFVTDEIDRGALTIPGFYSDWAKPTFNIVKFLLYAFSFVLIWPYIPGSQSPIFQGVSVFLGIIFSLGSSSAISNAVAGLVITYMRPFKLGDRVKIGEVTGDIIEKSFLVTRVRTIKNEDITIPNAAILSGHTINYTTSAKELGLILHTSVTIGYDVPWKQVHQLLIDAALATKGIIKESPKNPFVFQTSLDDFYVSYQLNAYTEESHQMAVIYSELHQHIQDKFNEAGVEILSPHYRAARDGNMTTVPASYLPKDYQAPPFNIKIDKPT
jgi:small-conductance mechanosensitive channel